MPFSSIPKKYLVVIIEAILVSLIAFGGVPPVFGWFIFAWLSAYFYAARFEDCVFIFVASIPLFLALPFPFFKEGVMSLWRPLSVVLFIKWVQHRGWRLPRFALPCLPCLVFVSSFFLFLGVGLVSLFRAQDLVLGIKQVVYFLNLAFCGFLVSQACKQMKDMFSLWKGFLVSLGMVLVAGYGQLVSVFFVPLFNFWKWWARQPIVAYYGENMGKVLARSNTWFSYYPSSPATLRMFSVFPDSHSFALFCLLGLIPVITIFLLRFLRRAQPIKIFTHLSQTWPWWGVIFLTLSAIVFSGTRGIWIAAGGMVVILIFVYLFRVVSRQVLAMAAAILLLFVISFPFASSILSLSQGFSPTGRGGQTGGRLMFERAATSFSLQEVSVKGRLTIWKQTLDSIIRHPLIGVGIGNFPVILDQSPEASQRGSSAHSLYLHIASEMGILGLIFFLGVVGSFLLQAAELLKKGTGPLRAYGASFLFFSIWGLGYSMVDVVLLNDKVALFFVALVGMLWGSRPS